MFVQDPRFNKIVDKKTGYHTTSILCMPILDYEDEVVGVAQIMNKMVGGSLAVFTQSDEQVRIQQIYTVSRKKTAQILFLQYLVECQPVSIIFRTV